MTGPAHVTGHFSDVVEPEVGDVYPKPEDFLKIWKRHAADMKRIEVMLAPAAEVIGKRFYDRYHKPSVKWMETELQTKDEVNYDVVLVLEAWIGGEMDSEAYILPLVVALGDPQAVDIFYEAEKVKQIAEAERQGLMRIAREKEDRRKIYDTLKKEFDPDGTQGQKIKENKAEASYPGGVVPV
jgi:hypothetical protein